MCSREHEGFLARCYSEFMGRTRHRCNMERDVVTAGAPGAERDHSRCSRLQLLHSPFSYAFLLLHTQGSWVLLPQEGGHRPRLSPGPSPMKLLLPDLQAPAANLPTCCKRPGCWATAVSHSACYMEALGTLEATLFSWDHCA